MKILTIRFKNINSLKGEHTIDFSTKPLSAAGLFAITGPTGSGKTTILDVITLALFCRIPRVSESISRGFIERTGLLLTRNMKEAMAEVTYTCSEGTYTSQWSISTNRNGNLRDYEMQISDDAGDLLDLKKSDVPARNENLIGLNFDQFVKAIILAQGDFAAFLKAKKDERGKLLERVTGTWIYRELGKAAYQKNREFGQVLENLQSQQRNQQAQLMPDEAYQDLLAEIKQINDEIQACQNHIQQLTGQETLKKDISELEASIQENIGKLDAEKQKLQVFVDIYGQPMEKHALMLPYRQRLWDWKQQGLDLRRQEERATEIDKALETCAAVDASIREAVRKLTGSGEPVTEALDAFQSKVLDLQRKLSHEKNQLDNQYHAVMEEAGDLLRGMGKADADRAKMLVEDATDTCSAQLKGLAESLSEVARHEPAKRLTEIKGAAATLHALIAENRVMQDQQRALSEKKAELEKLRGELAAIPAQLEQTVSDKNQAEQHLQGLQKDRTIRNLTASLEEYRKRLVVDEPCPLCGATEHPFSEGIPDFQDDLDQQIEAFSKKNNDLQKTITFLETTSSLKQKAIEKIQKELSEKEAVLKLSEEKAGALKQALPQSYQSIEPASALKSAQQEEAAIETWVKLSDKARLLGRVAKKIDSWEVHSGAVHALSEQLRSLFAGDDVLSVIRGLHDRFVGNNERKRSLDREQAALAESIRQAREAFQQLQDTLKQDLPGYDSLAAALEELMDDREYAALQDKRSALTQGISGMAAGLTVQQTNLLRMKEADVDTSVDEIKAQKAAKEAERDTLNGRRDELMAQQTLHHGTLQRLEALELEIRAQKKHSEKWVLLNKYIGDAEGKRFSTFAQELTLLQLVHKANERLGLLNDRYLLGLPGDGEDDSLAVIDSHMGDMRRSVKSLSGGETFLVSLALALALSDLAARKVEINSLFIDEGFGSLDKLTLDQTMDTLEKLQYETNKTIGVISHVEAMQERITTQIKLEKGGQGHSMLTVV